MRIRWARGAWLAAIVILAQSCLGSGSSTVSAAPRTAGNAGATGANAPIMLYGDSIGYEISPYLKARLKQRARITLAARTFGGTNACDWLGLAKEDNILYKPKYVVIIFTGNIFTACMDFIGQSPTRTAIVDRTILGIRNLMARFPTAHFFLVGYARGVQSQAAYENGSITVTDLLNWRLAQLARSTPSTYVPASKVLYDSKGRSSQSLPCTRALDGGLCGASKSVVVRAPDGFHLCPVTPPAVLGVLPKCAVPSAGALRLANLIDSAIARFAT